MKWNLIGQGQPELDLPPERGEVPLLLQSILEQHHAGVVLPCGVGPFALRELDGLELSLPLCLCCLLQFRKILEQTFHMHNEV